MMKQNKNKYLLMIVHISIIVLTIFFKENKILSFLLGSALLCISLITIVYMCYLAVNDDFYLQIIFVVFILLMMEDMGWDYKAFTDNASHVFIHLIIVSLIISVLIGIKCKTKKQKDCVTPAVAIFILLVIFTISSANVLNISLSNNESHIVTYMMVEKTHEYEPLIAGESTTTYKVSPLTDNYGFDIKELEVKQSLDVDTSDVVVVEIREGLFDNVYRVIENT